MICIDGPMGSGKTTLAGALAREVGGAIVHMDDLYGGWDGIDRAWPRLVSSVLTPLRAGHAAAVRTFDWSAGGFTGPVTRIESGRPVIAEGCGSAPRLADGVAQLIVWVDAALPVRLARVARRDGPAQSENLRAWAVSEAVHYAREGTRDRADVIVRTDVPPA
ncbi:MAG: AAA family ATPase [Bifidobacteriaceae bacterium]|nr:AAA family ATPase [Bifidobacteriaceae bacterium]